MRRYPRRYPTPCPRCQEVRRLFFDASVRAFLAATLRQKGYTVIEAENGQEAIQIYGENHDRIQLLIFDVIMPKKSGKVAYEEIGKDQPDVKIVLMSGYMADAMSAEGIIEEEFHFIPKPVLSHDLLRVVREALDGLRRDQR